MTKTSYDTPKQHYFRLHHIRPRFKNDVERVLLFVANEISQMKESSKKDFDFRLNKLIRKFPGNRIVAEKTISNWRTEISSLFGLVLYDPKNETEKPSPIAIKLAENQDLVEFFKYYCYSFQYPGGHLKTHEIKKIIDANIKFKPVQFILKLLKKAKDNDSFVFGITKAEATHCIFNDLRVTTGKINEDYVLSLIEKNRSKKRDYDWTGDVIRYAGDILDYMYYANLLRRHGRNYCINESEMETIISFISDDSYFDGFDKFYGQDFDVSELKSPQINWFYYLIKQNEHADFETDVIAYLGLDSSKYKQLEKLTGALDITEFRGAIEATEDLRTKEIGDTGESLVHGHECMRLKIGGRDDLISKVVCLPNHLKLGYDIRSFELNSKVRCIEVKTTISNTDIDFKKLHLTDNEWNVAQSFADKYFIYRLVITRHSLKMFIIKNPVEEYKKGNLKMVMAKGVDITFTDKSGNYEELLAWEG